MQGLTKIFETGETLEASEMNDIVGKVNELVQYANTAPVTEVGNGRLTIKQGGVEKGTFTANQDGDVTVNLDAGGGGGGEPDAYIKSASASGNTLTLTKKDGTQVEFTPSVPTVNNGTLTIKQGGVTKGTFSANQSTSATINLDAGGSGESGVFIAEYGVTEWADVNSALTAGKVVLCKRVIASPAQDARDEYYIASRKSTSAADKPVTFCSVKNGAVSELSVSVLSGETQWSSVNAKYAVTNTQMAGWDAKQDKIGIVTSLSGGRIPANKVCELGTLSLVTVVFAIEAATDLTVENRWMVSFAVGAQVRSISFPLNVVFPTTPTWEAGKHYEVSLRYVQSEDKYYALVQSW